MIRVTPAIAPVYTAELLPDNFFAPSYAAIGKHDGKYWVGNSVVKEDKVKQYIADLQELLTR